MRLGVREICDVVFRPLTAVDIGNQHFDAGQPVLYLDTAKTSTLEGAATTVYAQGGRGNARLIGWDGEKTLTFTVEDALISTVSFAMLSGAGVIDATSDHKIYTHQVYDLVVEAAGTGENQIKYATLPPDVSESAILVVSKEAPIYATTLDSAGAPKIFLSAITDKEIYAETPTSADATGIVGNKGEIDTAGKTLYFKLNAGSYQDPDAVKVGDTVRIDCYVAHAGSAQEIQIAADTFAGYYYIEADTLFRDEATGQDLPAQFVIPRGKIQSNFTFTMANSGDPSTFTFTIDAFPAYTKFNKRKKVMAALQVVDTTGKAGHNYDNKAIIGHEEVYHRDDIYEDFEGTAPYTKSIFD